MRKIVFFLLLLAFAGGVIFAEVKEADKAGSWYPGKKTDLENILSREMAAAKPEPINGTIIAMISPHAGYTFSAPVAVYGYKELENKGIKTAIIVGFNHRFAHEGIAVADYESYRTPLGDVPVNKEITAELLTKNAKIYPKKEAFYDEQSTELQIPYLQTALTDFSIVIISVGDQSLENADILADALYDVLKDRKDYVIIASSDMCHYLPYDKNNQVDAYTISELRKFDGDQFYAASTRNGHRLMCGYGAVTAVMKACKRLGADDFVLLKHANSGDVYFDKTGVVGYLSALMVKTEKAGCMLNSQQKKKMLGLARKTIETYLKTGKKLEVKEDDPVLNMEMGAFVTLHEHGELRGCIGNMVGRGPFYLTVRDMAIEAATGDPRFHPVVIGEMKDIDIEISALSPLEVITDPNKIVAGKHGVIVHQGMRGGVYLPQVATEQGWTRDEFMNSLCEHKAGIDRDAWKTGKCKMEIFTAQVFGEKDK